MEQLAREGSTEAAERGELGLLQLLLQIALCCCSLQCLEVLCYAVQCAVLPVYNQLIAPVHATLGGALSTPPDRSLPLTLTLTALTTCTTPVSFPVSRGLLFYFSSCSYFYFLFSIFYFSLFIFLYLTNRALSHFRSSS
jgi:hypothetical protein